MNLILFGIVSGITIVGWIWHFIENKPEKTLMEEVTNKPEYSMMGATVKGDSLWDKYVTKENINDFWTGKGIFQSKFKPTKAYSLSGYEFQRLWNLRTEVRQIALRNVSGFEFNELRKGSEFYEIMKEIEGSKKNKIKII